MKTILVICDIDEDISRLRDILEETYTLNVLPSPGEGLKRLRTETKDISAILLDHPAKNRGSRELIDFVAESNDYLFAIPVLIMTDEENADNDLKFIGKAAIDSIERPFHRNIVKNRVRKAVSMSYNVSFEEFSEMLKVLPSMIYLKDASSRYVFCSQIWHHIDASSDPNWTIVGKTDLEIRKDRENAMRAMESDMEIVRKGKGVSYIVPEDNGREYLQIIKEPLRNKDGRVKGIIALINDVTEQEMLKKELARIAATDKLTGLYNRRYGLEYLSSTHKQALISGEKYAVFCIDLNHFKPINDTYGHEMGDMVLEEMGRRLKDLPEQFTAIRTGGDEFLVILKCPWDLREIRSAGDRLKALFREPVSVDPYVFRLSGSIGAAVYPDDGDDPGLLMKYADAAMYEVKHSEDRAACRFYDATMALDVTRMERLNRFMKEVVPERDMELMFRPVVDSIDKKIVGAEVSVRIRDEEFQNYSNAELLNSANENGRLKVTGEFVIKETVKNVAMWKEKGYDDIMTDINILPLQLLDGSFIEMLKTEVKSHELDPHFFILDMGSRVESQTTDSELVTLQGLRTDGFRLAISGFSGENMDLVHFRRMGLEFVKLSDRLTDRICQDSDAQELIRAIGAMAGAMNVAVLAANVCDDVQAEALRKAGVTGLEGDVFGQAVGADEMDGLLAEDNRKE